MLVARSIRRYGNHPNRFYTEKLPTESIEFFRDRKFAAKKPGVSRGLLGDDPHPFDARAPPVEIDGLDANRVPPAPKKYCRRPTGGAAGFTPTGTTLWPVVEEIHFAQAALGIESASPHDLAASSRFQNAPSQDAQFGIAVDEEVGLGPA